LKTKICKISYKKYQGEKVVPINLPFPSIMHCFDKGETALFLLLQLLLLLFTLRVLSRLAATTVGTAELFDRWQEEGVLGELLLRFSFILFSFFKFVFFIYKGRLPNNDFLPSPCFSFLWLLLDSSILIFLFLFSHK